MQEGHRYSRPSVDFSNEGAIVAPSIVSQPFFPRATTLEKAAHYVGLDQIRFLTLVTTSRMPEPIEVEGVEIWDRLELDAAFNSVRRRPNKVDES
jgi:hypothetical protein